MSKKHAWCAVYRSPTGGHQTRMRASIALYTHAAVVDFGGTSDPVIYSFHKSEEAAKRGSLTKMQRDSGAEVVTVVPVRCINAKSGHSCRGDSGLIA